MVIKTIRFIVLTGLFIILMVFCSVAKKSKLRDDIKEIDTDYPTKLHSLPSNKLQLLQQEFDHLNNNKIQIKLNNLGYTGEKDYTKKSHRNPGIKVSKAGAVQIAVQCVLKNKKFTNVNDSNVLVNSISDINVLEQDSTNWCIHFGPQKCNGIMVYYSTIRVYVYGDGVYRLFGFWYPNVHIPEKNVIDIEEAKEIISGTKLIWRGEMREPHKLIVAENTIDDNITKVVFPYNGLRVVWEIPIKLDGIIGWHIYVDVMTGEIIKINQEFRT